MQQLVSRTALVLAIAAASLPAMAQDNSHASITLYRSDDDALFSSSNDSGSIDAGYAVVREQRALTLETGTHDVVLGDLPEHLDTEALALGFPDGKATVLSQRLLLDHGDNAALTGLTGSQIDVLGPDGQTLAQGTLLRGSPQGLIIANAQGGTTLVRQYAAVRSQAGAFPTGASLSLKVDAQRSGQTRAVLSYPTSGLGWRASYVGTLQPGTTCRMQFEARASIANQSGRDWHDAALTLIAGEPSFAKSSAPRPMMRAMAMPVAMAAPAMPQQRSLDNYRSYTLPTAVDLPDGSVTQTPLYGARNVDCMREDVYENGSAYSYPSPMLQQDFNDGSSDSISSTLQFNAFDSLPAGYLRALTADRDGVPQFIGEARIDDTPKGASVTATLGTAFDLKGKRERTAFKLDRAAHQLQESFRITLTNASDSTRTVTVREHPGRWRNWSLLESSSKPSTQNPQTLEFKLAVPAQGSTELTYTVRYQWTAADLPHAN